MSIRNSTLKKLTACLHNNFGLKKLSCLVQNVFKSQIHQYADSFGSTLAIEFCRIQLYTSNLRFEFDIMCEIPNILLSNTKFVRV